MQNLIEICTENAGELLISNFGKEVLYEVRPWILYCVMENYVLFSPEVLKILKICYSCDIFSYVSEIYDPYIRLDLSVLNSVLHESSS